MRKLTSILFLAAYLSGCVVCPCLAAADAADATPHHGQSAADDCHGLSDAANCSSATMFAAVDADAPEVVSKPTADEDESAAAGNAYTSLPVRSRQSFGPPLRAGPLTQLTPVTRGDVLIE